MDRLPQIVPYLRRRCPTGATRFFDEPFPWAHPRNVHVAGEDEDAVRNRQSIARVSTVVAVHAPPALLGRGQTVVVRRPRLALHVARREAHEDRRLAKIAAPEVDAVLRKEAPEAVRPANGLVAILRRGSRVFVPEHHEIVPGLAKGFPVEDAVVVLRSPDVDEAEIRLGPGEPAVAAFGVADAHADGGEARLHVLPPAAGGHAVVVHPTGISLHALRFKDFMFVSFLFTQAIAKPLNISHAKFATCAKFRF